MLLKLGHASKLVTGPCAFASCKYFSTVVDEIISFARQPDKRDWNEVSDILKSGMAQHTGLQAGRLHIAIAELAFENNKWGNAVEASEQALDIAQEGVGSSPASRQLSSDIQSSAEEIRFRALLASGSDEEAATASQKGLSAAENLPDGPEFQAIKWKAKIEAQSRHAYASMILGKHESASRQMKGIADLQRQHPAASPQRIEQPSKANGDPENVSEVEENSVLPMQPGDLDICSSLLRCGAYFFGQGDSIAAGRYLQRAAMAAEAASAQNQEAGQGSKSQPVTKLLLQETSLAAFLGHVQIGFSRATDAQGWKRLEQHLESALGRAEAISGMEHARVMSSLVLLGDVYTHTERPTFGEGLYRSASKMVYRSPNPPQPLVFRQQPAAVHDSLSCLLAWRYAQLLTVLPKRETEASFWQKQAEQLLPSNLQARSLEDSFGPLAYLRGGGAQADGIFVDNSCRRVIPCANPIAK